jgi:hypothetical protein
LIEDTLKSVVRGNSVGPLQESFQPVETLLPEGNDVLPVLGAGDGRTNRDDDDVVKKVQAAVSASGIVQLSEVM